MLNEISRRKFLKIGSMGLIASSFGETLLDNKESESFFFIHIGDPQLFWGPEKNWERAIAECNRLKPAFVVVGGDMINNDGNSNKHDFSKDKPMVEAYLRIAAKLDKSIPLYHVAGNHDVCNVPTPETYTWYNKYFGKLWYSFEKNNSLFIGLESCVMKSPQGHRQAYEQQLAWLEKTLQESDKRKHNHKIVFQHHPVCLKDVNEGNGYFQLSREFRTKLIKLFEKHKVSAVFSGHLHQNAHVKHGKIEFVTTSSCGKALGKDPLGLRIVKVHPDRIIHNYYGFEKIPKNISL